MRRKAELNAPPRMSFNSNNRARSSSHSQSTSSVDTSADHSGSAHHAANGGANGGKGNSADPAASASVDADDFNTLQHAKASNHDDWAKRTASFEAHSNLKRSSRWDGLSALSPGPSSAFDHEGPSSPSGGSVTASAVWPHSPIAIASTLLYVLFGTISTTKLPNAVLIHPEASLTITLGHFLILGLLASLHGRVRPDSSPFARPWRLWVQPYTHTIHSDSRRVWTSRVLGLASSMSLMASMRAASLLDGRVSAAVEIQVIPFILMLAVCTPLNSLLPNSTRAGLPNQTLSTIAIATAFLVAFSLIGAPADPIGLSAVLMRIPIEAIRIVVLREALLDSNQLGEMLIGAASVSGSCSLRVAVVSTLISGIIPLVFSLDDLRDLWALQSISDFFAFSVWYLLSQLALFASLAYASSSLCPAIALFPRNFILLILSTMDRFGVPLRASWSQMAVVLAGGTIATLCADPDTVAFYSCLTTRATHLIKPVTQGRGNYLHLPSSSADIPLASPPIIPASSSPKKQYAPSSTHSPSISLRTAILPLLPLLYFIIQHPDSGLRLDMACRVLPATARGSFCSAPSLDVLTSRSVDIVVSYYKENPQAAKAHIAAMKAVPFVQQRDHKVIVYDKGRNDETQLRNALELSPHDEVIRLPNVGREGATYLQVSCSALQSPQPGYWLLFADLCSFPVARQHILRHYNATVSLLDAEINTCAAAQHIAPRDANRVLADHTFFLQPHLAWDWIARPRINLVAPDTGFAHFGPLLRTDCGVDGRGRSTFPYVKAFYSIFTGDICPPTGQLVSLFDRLIALTALTLMDHSHPYSRRVQSAWSAQFAVSRRRIMANTYTRYAHLSSLMEAPEGHWVHDMWGPDNSGGPSNPALGHHLERSWPIVFGCTDPTIADECPDDVHEKDKCQCLDS
ncbi:BQ2448_1163 [Microbotryum intermedium]|uniref:BQ2448_1163 protein n=1 Tax=Microbotryum intermedium TaxID=269621 RepID=A0A238FAG9_9BASI|nr:BQ2448_1163 [Microbotryum intermedium]